MTVLSVLTNYRLTDSLKVPANDRHGVADIVDELRENRASVTTAD